MVGDETFVKGGKSALLTSAQLDEPGVGDLAMPLDWAWRKFLIAEVVVPELMLGMGKDAFESLPSGSRRWVAGELHMETEEGSLSDRASGEG